MKTGIPGGVFNILSETDLHRIHEASLSLLANHGVLSQSSAILELFQLSGADVDAESRLIRVPPGLVEAALKSAPKSFVFHGRDPAMDLLLESGRVYYGMGGASEPYFWDYDLGQPRSPTKADMLGRRCTGGAEFPA